MTKLASRRIALVLGLLLVTSPLVAASIAAASSRTRAPRLRTVRVAGKLYTVGCMTSSLCVAGGLLSGQGVPVQVVVLRGGRIIGSRRLAKSLFSLSAPPGEAAVTKAIVNAFATCRTASDGYRIEFEWR